MPTGFLSHSLLFPYTSERSAYQKSRRSIVIYGRFTHTGPFHILTASFSMHSCSIFFLSLRLNILNAVPVPYILSWTLKRPASLQIFTKPGRSLQGQPLPHHDRQPLPIPAPHLCTARASRVLAKSLDNVQM